MKPLRNALLIATAVLIGIGSGQGNIDPAVEPPINTDTPATAYSRANGLIGEVVAAPMDVTCGRWRGWFTVSAYCDDTLFCALTTLPFEGRFEDQYRWRECRVTETGETRQEYQFRTILKECCGFEL